MEPLPHAGLLPLAQPSPAGRPTAAAQLLREQPPGTTRAQDEDDAGESSAVRDTGAATLGLRELRGQQGFNGFPEIVGDQGLAHSNDASCHPHAGFETRS